MRPVSNAKRVSQEADDCKKEVCRLLVWTELEYCNFQYECGLRYLAVYLNGDQWGVDLIHRCRAFWSWWKSHWVTRDQEFIAHAHFPCVRENLNPLYLSQHEPDALAKAIYPNGFVLQDTYAEMMVKLIDQTT
jgi:hypothetical protein